MPVQLRTLLPQLLCSAWIVGFLVFFHCQDPANNDVWSRGGIWLEAVLNPALLNPFDFSHATAPGVDSGWHTIPHRWPFFQIAAMLALSAVATGAVIARPLIRSAALTRCESFVVCAGLGLSFQSLWTLVVGVFGQLSALTVVAPGIVSILILAAVCARQMLSQPTEVNRSLARPSFEPAPAWLWIGVGMLAFPFLVSLLLNGFTPPWEFDVCEYHLQGPREWFEAGQITFLEHNVYTSFPFLSEMLSLSTMVLADDWSDGAVSSKVVLSGFQLLTTLSVFAIARRWYGTGAGLIAAVVYLSVPWTLRITLIAYAEGATTFFLTATVMCGLIACREDRTSVRHRLTLLTGLLAGSAMAAKYPGLVSVVLPAGSLLLWSSRRQTRTLLTTSLLFAAGTLCTIGPWLIRNTINTGNPVYPLMYSVFGAADWSPAMDAKWKNGHSPSEHSLAMIPYHLLSIVAHSDWTSGLLFGLSVPTLLLLRKHRETRWLWAAVVWVLTTWWALTHRIDRFWIPVIPVTAVLAGAAWPMFRSSSWRVLLTASVAGCSLFNLQFWRMPPSVTGLQIGLMDLDRVRALVVRPDFKQLNQTLSSEDRILLIGEAEVFDLQVPFFYNTVFDESLFEQWTADETDERHWSAERRMKPADAVRDVLKAKGVTHVYVNWLEILRYRRPGSYSYTEYVMPERLSTLVNAGVLSEPTAPGRAYWNDLPAEDRDLISTWPGYETLLRGGSDPVKQSWTPKLLYKVL